MSESSSSESSLSERNPLSHDYDARVLSAVCDAAAGRTATAPPPPGINVQAVRRMLTTLGVNPQTLLTIEDDAVFAAYLADWDHVRTAAATP